MTRHFPGPRQLLDYQAAHTGIGYPYVEIHRICFAPGSFRNDNHSAIGDLITEIAPDALYIHRVRLNHDDLRCAAPQRIVAKTADVSADVHDDVARLDTTARRGFAYPLLVGSDKSQQMFSVHSRPIFLDPEGTRGRIEQLDSDRIVPQGGNLF